MSDASAQPAGTNDEDGLAFACGLDGKGGGRALDWAGVEAWSPADGPLWVHLDRASPRTARWIGERDYIPEIALKALLAEETRPRVFSVETGIVAILRGINLNAGADTDDMVALRIWVDGDRVITVRQRRLMTPRDILSELVDHRTGPKSAPELFVRLAERLTERMNSVIVALDENLDEIEEGLEDGDLGARRRDLSELRQTCVRLRRYIGPQREALAWLQTEHRGWLTNELKISLRESADRLQRYIEDLDSARERAMVIRDEIANRLSESMNRTMYALSMVAGVFLPLGFLTGLLGINVGGMPGVDSGSAFWITCALLVLLGIGEVALFRRMKWL